LHSIASAASNILLACRQYALGWTSFNIYYLAKYADSHSRFGKEQAAQNSGVFIEIPHINNIDLKSPAGKNKPHNTLLSSFQH
jgi:hypothetical protein